MNNGIFNLKKEKNKKIKSDFGFAQKIKPIGLIKIKDKNLIKDLRDGFLNLKAGFIIEIEGIQKEILGNNIIAVGSIEKEDLPGFDFVVFDEIDVDINDYIHNGIVPIIKNDCHLSSIFTQFNPLKNEGNSILYESFNKWSIFEGIIKYNENFKFPYDNKNLVKKVLNI